MKNISELVKAEGTNLLMPLGFGKYKGKKIWDIDSGYASWIEETTNVSPGTVAKQQALARDIDAKEKKRKEKLVESSKNIIDNSLLDLFAHQSNFISRFAASDYGAMFFEMGLGKTLTMLEMYNLRRASGERMLVVCPLSVFSSWESEAKKHYKGKLSTISISGTVEDKIYKLDQKRDIYIINHEALRRTKDRKKSKKGNPVYNPSPIKDKLEEMGFEWIVIDESHKIKDPSSSTYLSLYSISENSKYRWILTGTPVTKDYRDLYSQITILDRGLRLGKSFWNFKNEYMDSRESSGYNRSYIEHSESKSKYDNLINTISELIDWRKKEDCIDLPERIYQLRQVELSGKSTSAYMKMLDEASLIFQNQEITAQNALTKILRLHQITGGGLIESSNTPDKICLLDEILDDISEPVVIVYTYTSELAKIKQLLQKKNLSYGVIAGSIKNEERKESLEKFKKSELNVMALQIQAGSTGIDGLQHASSTMIFYSYNYSWAMRQQAEARIHRTGQNKPCVYIDLEAKLPSGLDTIDSVIREAVKNKDASIKDFLNMVEKQIIKLTQ